MLKKIDSVTCGDSPYQRGYFECIFVKHNEINLPWGGDFVGT